MLALCGHLPHRRVRAGQVLLQEGVPNDRLYILRTGAFDVVRGGVRVVSIDEPGAFLGEISVLLGSAPSASVVAVRGGSVHVLEGAAAAVRTSPELTHAIAQLLARRLQAITAYLVDLKRQYGGSETHLDLMDQVLAQLIASHKAPASFGSERDRYAG